MALLIVGGHSHGADSVCQGALLDRRVGDAYLLLAPDRHREFGRLRHALTHDPDLVLSVERGACTIRGVAEV